MTVADYYEAGRQPTEGSGDNSQASDKQHFLHAGSLSESGCL